MSVGFERYLLLPILLLKLPSFVSVHESTDKIFLLEHQDLIYGIRLSSHLRYLLKFVCDI